ncbi:MAG TPA: hypothetical protein VF629_19170 [Hymenobacter sp.]|jgi:hypothetical protein|uniref:hypothetical protein n=1 Tax=Hymenobacter sp. TaxID=1898978 RepID=UPI002EDB38A3
MKLERDASSALRGTYFNFICRQFQAGGQPAGVMVLAFEVTELVMARKALEGLPGSADASA